MCRRCGDFGVIYSRLYREYVDCSPSLSLSPPLLSLSPLPSLPYVALHENHTVIALINSCNGSRSNWCSSGGGGDR